MNGKATQEVMDLLHGLMAEGMTEELRRGLERASQPPRIVDPDDACKTIANPDYEPLSPKLLGVIRAFLKDNGIDAPASSPRFNGLIDELRDLNVEDMARA
jgi:hypothetical protein